MDRHAESACDVADDLITGQRIAAARKLDQTIVESFNVDSGAYMTLALGAALMEKADFVNAVGAENFQPNIDAALDRAEKIIGK